MKKHFFIPVIISVILLSGCSKDEPEYVPLISTIRKIYAQSDYTYKFNYDSLNRWADYTYESDKFYSKGTETYPNGTPKEEKIFFLDKSGKVTQYYSALWNGQTYLVTYGYDSKNRFSTVKVESRKLNSNGDPIGDYQLFSNAMIEWDNNNNVEKITHNYDTGLLTETFFTEYTTIKSTLSCKNFGWNFFGTYQAFDIRSYMIPIYNYMYVVGSTYLPGKKEIKSYINGNMIAHVTDTYYYKTDEKNRVTELLIRLKSTNVSTNVDTELTERYEYTYKN